MTRVPDPVNQPVRSFAPGAPERRSLQKEIQRQSAVAIEIPLVIGGKEVRTGRTANVVMPHRHAHVLGTWHKAGKKEAERAVQAALDARREWASWSFEDRAAVFLRAADMLATSRRDDVHVATMLNQSKTAHQSEIDSICETVDFLRFNVAFAERLLQDQPLSGPGTWNRMDYRPLEGFVFAVTPFNFTAIAANLPAAPALMGNTVVWKCASTTVYSNYKVMQLFQDAGLPPGVINFIPGDAGEIGEAVLGHSDLAGIHFTGSTEVFRTMWKKVGENIGIYRSYPRLIGETGGKDFILAHSSADPDALVAAVVRGGFELQGQKCSALSRLYVPEKMWKGMKDRLLDTIRSIRMGDVADLTNFMGAVIDGKSFRRIADYIDEARHSSDAELLVGGETDDTVGYFIRPTLIQAKRPDYRTMCEEIFGPVVTVYVYPENEWEKTINLVDKSTPYALTGAVFATDRSAVVQASSALRYAAGNFYINDKPTGAVVGQQPFGGARASGTNDKAGSILNLMRWVSARTIKETFVPPTDYRYPFLDSE